MKCQVCGFEIPAGMKFCGMCGAVAAKPCTRCGASNPLSYRFCGQCGAALDREGSSEQGGGQLPLLDLASLSPAAQPLRQLEGERRLATVLMADVFDSTGLLERIGSEAWVDLMNQVLQIMEREVNRLGGQVDQFRGDGLVAFFGSTSVHEDDPERGVLAGLAIQQALVAFAAEIQAQRDIQLKVRVGVNTGDLILTSVGDTRLRVQDTGMGEAVTIAARMESAAEPGTVLVSQFTYRLIAERFQWLPLGKTMVKGISTPIDTYRPLAHLADAERQRGLDIRGLPLDLVLRTAQIKMLRSQLDLLQRGRGGIVLLMGETGMGKSFLVRHVYTHYVEEGLVVNNGNGDHQNGAEEISASTSTRMTWLRGYCRSFEQHWPFAVWADVMQKWLGIQPDEPGQESLERLRNKLEELDGGQLNWSYPYLATFLGLPLEAEQQEHIQRLDAEDLHQQVFWSLRSWVLALANQGPLVMAFAYLQWADQASLDLLKTCLPLSDDKPVLWLLTFQPDRGSPIWAFRQFIEKEFHYRLTTIELNPLNAEESKQLIDQIVGPGILTDHTLSLVIQKAEGNPYYLIELLAALIEKGVLQRNEEHGVWKEMRSVTSLDLPDSVQNLLLAQVNRLSPDERQILQVSAVIGGVFWRNLLQHILEVPEEQLRATLNGLLRAQIIQERNLSPDLGIEYAFNSSLIRDVVYDNLLSTQRNLHHLRVAEALEACIHPESTKRYEGLIAYHYRHGHDLNKELFYTLLAAEYARKIYANGEAVQSYTRALEILDEMDEDEDKVQKKATDRVYASQTQRFEILNGRRQVYALMGDLEAARNDGRALLPLAEMLVDDPTWKIEALLAQPEVTAPDNRDEMTAGLVKVEDALNLSRKLGDPHREMNSLLALCSAYNLLNNPSWLDIARQALDISRQVGDRKMEVNILLKIGNGLGVDSLQESQQYLEAAYAASRQLDDRSVQVDLLEMLGTQAERQGDYYHQLVEYEQERLKISREIGRRLSETHALMKCGQIQGIYLGDHAGGYQLLEQARLAAGNTTNRFFTLIRMIQLKIIQQQYSEAQALLAEAEPLGELVAENIGRAGLALVTCLLNNAIGDEEHYYQALTHATQVWQMATENLVSRQYLLAAACEMAAAHLGLGRLRDDSFEKPKHMRKALQFSQSAMDVYKSFGFVQIIECTSEEVLFRHGIILRENGRLDEGAQYQQKAYAEMMRKHAFIPQESEFRGTFLQNPLHQQIQAVFS